uniref:AsIV-cont00115-ORF2 n=1 Tax=Apophua simplicipes ichnovirus TaxID=1329648 RepID=S5DYZ6_9VIRU|nr:AsIV-cont00115-ORF2 [Apophua simplicipes ichnovirus]
MERFPGFTPAKLEPTQRVGSCVAKSNVLNFKFATNMGKSQKFPPITVDFLNVRQNKVSHHHDEMDTLFFHEVQKIALLSVLGCLHNDKFFFIHKSILKRNRITMVTAQPKCVGHNVNCAMNDTTA